MPLGFEGDLLRVFDLVVEGDYPYHFSSYFGRIQIVSCAFVSQSNFLPVEFVVPVASAPKVEPGRKSGHPLDGPAQHYYYGRGLCVLVEITFIELNRRMREDGSRQRARVSPDFRQDKIVTKKVQNYIFKLDYVLGKGSFSTVYRGVHEFTKETVAIKVVEMSRMHSTLLRDLLHSEIEILKRLWHPNILKCYEVFFSMNHCYIVTEYCNEGDLATIVRQHGPFNQKSAVPVVSGIFEGLKYLEKEGVIHRDLKLANVFVKNGVPKIADFGFAKKSRQRFKDVSIGSPLFMSPEGILHGYYGPKTDVWAFGILLYQLFHGHHVFDYCRTQQDLKQAVTKPLKPQRIDPYLSDSLRELILNCLEIGEVVRPSFQEISEMDFIKYLQEGLKQSNLIVSQVEQFPQKSLETTQALTCKLDKEPKRALKTFDMSELQAFENRNNKLSSFDRKVNSPKSGGGLNLSKLRRISDNIHLPSQRERSKHFNDTSEIKKLRGMSGVKDRSKNTSKIRQMLPNYKSTGYLVKGIYESPRNKGLSEKIIRCSIKFQCFVALLHYCRLLFKTAKLLTKLQIKEIDTIVEWLFSILEQLEEKLNSQLSMTSQQQLNKLKEVVRDYSIKYRKELFSRRKGVCNLQQNQTFILGCLKTIDALSRSEDQPQNNLILSALNHLIFLYDTNQLLRKAMETKDYEMFAEGSSIEEFLSSDERGRLKTKGRRAVSPR